MDAGTSFAGMGGLRGALRAPEFGGFEEAGFVASCGARGRAATTLDATALRTGTAGPPGQPMAAVPTWAVVGSAFVVGCWVWE
jgi:hypothetical protein